MQTYRPYVYHIAWDDLGVHYYGVRFARACSPDDLWNPYRTSSAYVQRFITENGEPDIIEVRKVFNTAADALAWETRFLVKIDAARRDNWLNRHNGARNFATTPESTMKVADALRGKKIGIKYHDPLTGKIRTIKEGEPIPEGYVKGQGNRQSMDTIENRVQYVRGKSKSEETRRKMSEAKLGTKRPAEAIKNAADGRRGKPIGKKYYNAELDIVKHFKDDATIPSGFVPGDKPGKTRKRKTWLDRLKASSNDLS